jgi:hypothetical protein
LFYALGEQTCLPMICPSTLKVSLQALYRSTHAALH